MGFLASVFGSRTRVNALAALVGGKKMTESELAAEASAPVSEVNRQFPALVASGLVRLERVGKSKVYSIDETHFLYPALKELFGSLDSALEGEARRVAGCVAARCNGLKAIILFGSVAARRARLGPEGLAPALLVLDEPFYTLDGERERLALKLLANFHRSTGWQIIFLTKDPKLAGAASIAEGLPVTKIELKIR
ncbi:hypothetical protein COY71_02080 [Candidatus Micrarchaeota archaeon CG_4_10_14_0_8_um_filter_60_7]|nr:MAG: hypothetical protein COY71_02080 [Candidatus Micrarchaeota archaeon CG_4_10_14_0_8_um_filter_60_7]